MQKSSWRLILPLAMLFVVGLLGFVSPAWLVGLSKAAKQYTPSELSEQWLGFFGNVIGALIAVFAAFIAWLIAQEQIKLTRQQNAVVTHEALQKLYQPLDRETDCLAQLTVIIHDYNILIDRSWADSMHPIEFLRQRGILQSRVNTPRQDIDALSEMPFPDSRTATRRSTLFAFLLNLDELLEEGATVDVKLKLATQIVGLSELGRDLADERDQIRKLLDAQYRIIVGS